MGMPVLHLCKWGKDRYDDFHLLKDPATGHLVKGVTGLTYTLEYYSGLYKKVSFKFASRPDPKPSDPPDPDAPKHEFARRSEGLPRLRREFDAAAWSKGRSTSCEAIWGNSLATGYVTPFWRASASAVVFERPPAPTYITNLLGLEIDISDYEHPSGGTIRAACTSLDNNRGDGLPTTMSGLKGLPYASIHGNGRKHVPTGNCELKKYIYVVLFVEDCNPPSEDGGTYPYPSVYAQFKRWYPKITVKVGTGNG